MKSEPNSLVIDHIGIVVGSLEKAISQWETLFGYTLSSDIITNTRQKVRVAFLSKDHSLTIKLVTPAEPASPVALLARRGGGLHHVCFRCDDLGVEVPLLQRKGARLTVPPEPGEAFCNHDIAFFSIENNLNVELIDTTRKAGRADTA
ncbi:MAG TPA: VOC family protein [Terracidiphilus sp.]|nr:VOC family protein [Terracidiphilus sp.]